MRKAICVVPIIGLLVLGIIGCASVSDPKVLTTVQKFAVVKVVSNSNIEWYGEERQKNDLLSDVTNLAANDTKPSETASAVLGRADDLVAKADAALAQALKGARGIQVAEETAVLSSKAYAAAAEDSIVGIGFLKPQGYKFVKREDAGLAYSLKTELGADGTISTGFHFTKAMKVGIGKNGTMGARVSMTVEVTDSTGKVVFIKSYQKDSDDAIAVVVGAYDPMKLQGLFQKPIEAVCNMFVADLNR